MMILKELMALREAKAKGVPGKAAKPDFLKNDDSPMGQLERLPQPVGINGGSYTYWVDVTKTPLKFVASDGSEVDEAKTLEDIAEWMDRWAAELWLEFLNGDEDLQHLSDEGVVRTKKGDTDQREHERLMHEETPADTAERHKREGMQFGRDVKAGKHKKLSDGELKKYSPAFQKAYLACCGVMEAKVKEPPVFVVAKLFMQGIDSESFDDIDLTVTTYTECKTMAEADALLAKMTEKMKAHEEIGEDPDDALVHMANNACPVNKSVHAVSGGATIESVKISKVQPKQTRKTFYLNPKDVGL